MEDPAVTAGPALAAALLVLTVTAALTGYHLRDRISRQMLTAVVRAVLQLAAVSTAIAVVLTSPWATAGFIVLMLTIAAATSARRVTTTIRRGRWVALPITAGALPILTALLATTAVPARTVAVLPIAGILIGGAMTATSLAGRRILDELRTRHGEYEAALAIGLTPREATLEICRTVAAHALVPALDQTRTVGLVTLPGAFVGVLLGGGTPAQAGATQLLVLVALLAAEGIAAVLTLEIIAAGRLPTPRTQAA
ncbi:ABC transporter permease [Micromonospora sp. BQ11]|uniref:ABC transporter permease n=1 Tax=Micromonospora sp. BQ11 TaxID=3452212 RepID=UPI003F8B2F65